MRPLSFRHRATLARILKGILATRSHDSCTDARKIYDWLLDNTQYRFNALDGFATLRNSIGHCIQLSRLYIALCRAAGIPARERHGLLIERQRFGDASFRGEARGCEPLFLHTWPEFHCPKDGWIPVETLPVGHGRNGISPWNFPDPEIRERMCSEQGLYDGYYFAGLDPFRIHGPCRTSNLPQLIRRRRDVWERVADPDRAVRHTIQAEGRLEG